MIRPQSKDLAVMPRKPRAAPPATAPAMWHRTAECLVGEFLSDALLETFDPVVQGFAPARHRRSLLRPFLPPAELSVLHRRRSRLHRRARHCVVALRCFVSKPSHRVIKRTEQTSQTGEKSLPDIGHRFRKPAKPERIEAVEGVAFAVGVGVQPPRKPNRITREKPLLLYVSAKTLYSRMISTSRPGHCCCNKPKIFSFATTPFKTRQ